MYKKKDNVRNKKVEAIKKYYDKINKTEESVLKYVREKTIEWLAESEKTRFQIEEKIFKNIDRKYEEAVSKILDYYESLNYINEKRFAEMFIRSKFFEYNGRTKINNELKKRGVNHENYELIFDNYDFNESVLEYTKRRTEGKELTQKEIDSFQLKLINKGFNFTQASNALKTIEKKKVVFESKEEMEYLDLNPTIKFIEKQMKKGYGLTKIKMELKHKGYIYTEELFEDFDFYEAAYNYRIKKYGKNIELDFKIRQKQQQHMLSRGFNFDEVKESFNEE